LHNAEIVKESHDDGEEDENLKSLKGGKCRGIA
jgi:hypothetical protein